MTKLREALLKKNKPKHQFSDLDSVNWLISNKPSKLGNSVIDTELIDKINNIAPWDKCKASWFYSNKIKDGIHGFRHCCRVAIFSIILGLRFRSLSKQDILALMYAGLLHDCRRMNDNADPNHGKRASAWLSKNKKRIRLPQGSFSNIHFAVAVHNDNYTEIKNKKSYIRNKFITDILKTADALDRYRFPRKDWWLNNNYLEIKPTIRELATAWKLAIGSEHIFLKTKSNRQSIRDAWIKIKVGDFDKPST